MFGLLKSNQLRINMDNNNWDTKQMFDYLREDIKTNREENRALANETNAKIDRIADILQKHVADDSKNFKELSERIACIETSEKTTDKLQERSYSHWASYAAIVISTLVGIGGACAVWFHK